MSGAGLTGLRVIEVGGGVSAPMAGKLFADLGAAVIKLEPPEGDPGRGRWPILAAGPPGEAGTADEGSAKVEMASGHFLYLNANKRSLVADLTTKEGEKGRAVLESLVEEADLLLHDIPPEKMGELGLEYGRLSTLNPRLVMVSITPFGLDGPYAAYQGADLPLVHGGGLGWLAPDKSPPPERPPLRPFGQHALLQAGMHGAIVGLAACHAASRTGVGEHVDLSALEVMTHLLCRHFVSYTYTGEVESRLGRNLTAPASFFPCRDGAIYLITVEQDQWERLVDMMGNPAWARGEAFASTILRGVPETMETIERGLAAWTAGWEVEALFHACQDRRIGSAPVYAPETLGNDPQLTDREFFRSLGHPGLGALRFPGPPYRLERSWWALRTPAPLLGEANREAGDHPARLFGARDSGHEGPAGARNHGRDSVAIADGGGTPGRPLEGVRVLDLSWVWAGPYAAQLLAFLGAEVVKVESSRRPDLARRLNLFADGREPGLNRNGYFNQIGQGKRSAAINLAHPDGLALVKRLACKSDVVLSNFATGVMERLGLGKDVLQGLKKDLIIANLSAYGQTGPYRTYTGYGPAIFPLAGLSSSTGYAEDGEPQNLRIAYADPNAGAYLAFAVLAALESKRRGGGGQGNWGQVIDISLWEAMICTGFEGWMAHSLGLPSPKPMGNRDPQYAPHNLFRCAGEDAWVAIAVTCEEQWRSLRNALGRPEWADDPRFVTAAKRKQAEDRLERLLGDWCRDKDKWEVTHRLQKAGVPAFPSLTNRELAENPHLEARGFLVLTDHPEAGERIHTGVPWRMTRRPNGVPSRAPLLGEHTDAVLAGVLGLGADEIASLRKSDAIE